MEFWMVSVFLDDSGDPFRSGNQLAAFPDAGSLTANQMQAIATTLHLSETTFVTRVDREGYDVRIFTPGAELPFAGHPTLGTAFCLRELGLTGEEEVIQRSAAGPTPVREAGGEWWFQRAGRVLDDLEATQESAAPKLARALSLEDSEIGLKARELGRSGLLRPGHADAGGGHLLVPLRDERALTRCVVRVELLAELTPIGVYCFTATAAGRVKARGFFPGLGVAEDPATGSAAAELGLFLAERLDPIDFDISQGAEIGRPSRLRVRARRGEVEIGGRCGVVLRGELHEGGARR